MSSQRLFPFFAIAQVPEVSGSSVDVPPLRQEAAGVWCSSDWRLQARNPRITMVFFMDLYFFGPIHKVYIGELFLADPFTEHT